MDDTNGFYKWIIQTYHTDASYRRMIRANHLLLHDVTASVLLVQGTGEAD